jgi:integrase
MKPIPLWHEGQKRCLEIIASGNFRRPLAKTMAHHFGERTNCYAGRKGFVDLMRSLGQDFEDISQWLGHQSVDMTWKHYRNRSTVKWKKAA